MIISQETLIAAISIEIFVISFGAYLLYQKYKSRYETLDFELRTQIVALEERLEASQQQAQEYKIVLTQYEKVELELIRELSTAESTLKERSAYFQTVRQEWENSQIKIERLHSELSQAKISIKELETLLESNQKIHQEKLLSFESNRIELKREFKELADSILKNNSHEFSMQNLQNITQMMTPVKEQFDAFKKQINDIYIQETKERAILQTEIHHIKEINLQMSKEANNLTNALKGESKTQGIWGEMILERVLQNSGLKEGESYKKEVSLQHQNESKGYRPDVIVYLPDRREIIIDSKTSLTAYEQYISTQNEEQKELFAKRHLFSIKQHVKTLSNKEYQSLQGVETLDFVFMFVPVESALLMAMEYDSTLFDYAFKKNIILVGPTTLMVALRAVENSWKNEYRNRNAQEIATRAGLLFDKFVGFVESMDKMGKQLSTLQKSYEESFNRLHGGAGSITSQFQMLQKLGAATNKKLPKEHIGKME